MRDRYLQRIRPFAGPAQGLAGCGCTECRAKKPCPCGVRGLSGSWYYNKHAGMYGDPGTPGAAPAEDPVEKAVVYTWIIGTALVLGAMGIFGTKGKKR